MKIDQLETPLFIGGYLTMVGSGVLLHQTLSLWWPALVFLVGLSAMIGSLFIATRDRY